MKILVTGGSGFIGSHIVEQLEKDKKNEIIIFDIAKPEVVHSSNVSYFDGDISFKTSVDRAIQGCEEVYDCAGVLGTHELVFQTERAIDTNIKGCFNVIQSSLENNVKRIFHPTKPFFKNYWENTYTISKISAENFVRMYRNVYNMDITILRWMNATGARQHLYPVRKFIPIIIMQALLNKDIEIYGTGEQTVDIIDVRDIANIAIQTTRSGISVGSNEVYDVGSGEAISCNDVAEYIIKKINSKSKIKHIPMRLGEALDTKIVAKTHSELFSKIKYQPQYSFDETIEECINYTKSLSSSFLQKSYEFFYK